MPSFGASATESHLLRPRTGMHVYMSVCRYQVSFRHLKGTLSGSSSGEMARRSANDSWLTVLSKQSIKVLPLFGLDI